MPGRVGEAGPGGAAKVQEGGGRSLPPGTPSRGRGRCRGGSGQSSADPALGVPCPGGVRPLAKTRQVAKIPETTLRAGWRWRREREPGLRDGSPEAAAFQALGWPAGPTGRRGGWRAPGSRGRVEGGGGRRRAGAAPPAGAAQAGPTRPSRDTPGAHALRGTPPPSGPAPPPRASPLAVFVSRPRGPWEPWPGRAAVVSIRDPPGPESANADSKSRQSQLWRDWVTRGASLPLAAWATPSLALDAGACPQWPGQQAPPGRRSGSVRRVAGPPGQPQSRATGFKGGSGGVGGRKALHNGCFLLESPAATCLAP